MNPWIIEDSVSVAANASIANIIAGNNALRSAMQAPFPFRGGFLAVNSATGLRITLDIGSKRIVYGSDLRASANFEDPIDIINDEFFGNEGDNIAIGVTNLTAGALTLKYRFVGMPLVDDSWESGMPFDLSPYADCMVMQRGPISIPNATNALDLLDGLNLARLPYPVMAKFFMTASAAGLIRELYIEQDRIAPQSAVSSTNRIPTDPWDVTIEGIQVPTNNAMILPVTNNSGGALNVFWKQKVYEISRR